MPRLYMPPLLLSEAFADAPPRPILNHDLIGIQPQDSDCPRDLNEGHFIRYAQFFELFFGDGFNARIPNWNTLALRPYRCVEHLAHAFEQQTAQVYATHRRRPPSMITRPRSPAPISNMLVLMPDEAGAEATSGTTCNPDGSAPVLMPIALPEES